MRASALVVALVASLTAPAAAQVRPFGVELSAFGGVWEGDDMFDTAAAFGARAQFHLSRVFGIELNYSGVPTNEFISQFGGNVVLNLSAGNFVPYLTAGAGLVNITENDFASNVGMGAKYYFSEDVGIRVDLRGWFSPEAPAEDSYAHMMATLGFVIQIGGDDDMDDDGLLNRFDKCPTQAEDKDGFEDDDGCPDEDNDKDGVKDADDKCPDAAEDKDDDRDEDGCPDVDEDGDGFDDEKDKCPKEAEDKDGFEDDDGCPDLDNDKDGIEDSKDACPDAPESRNDFMDDDGCPEDDADKDTFFDAQDQCVNEAEVFNGFKDGDGCPDALPEDLVAVLGIQTSVVWGKGKSDVSKRTEKVLDAIGEVVARYPGVVFSIEATAHGVDDALKVSKARAEAARDFLVAKEGIDAKQVRAVGLGAKPLPDSPPKDARPDRLIVELVVDRDLAKTAPIVKKAETPKAETPKAETPTPETPQPDAAK